LIAPIISDQLSVISYQLSVISYQLSLAPKFVGSKAPRFVVAKAPRFVVGALAPKFVVAKAPSARKRKFSDHLSQQLKQLSESSSTLKGTTRRLVGFSLLELLAMSFSSWRGGTGISAFRH